MSNSHSSVIARLDRAIQYAAAYRLKQWRLWNTGCPLEAGMTAERHAPAFSRHQLPEECIVRIPLKSKRAQGRPGIG